jgi:hypothetical protein
MRTLLLQKVLKELKKRLCVCVCVCGVVCVCVIYNNALFHVLLCVLLLLTGFCHFGYVRQ